MGSQAVKEVPGLAKSEQELREKLFGQWLTFFRIPGSDLPSQTQSLMALLRDSRRHRLESLKLSAPMPAGAIHAMHITDEDVSIVASILKASDAPHDIQESWPRLLKAVNNILDVHGIGKATVYPVDRTLHVPTTGDYISFIREFVSWECSRPLDSDRNSIPISDALDFAVILLYANCRDDAIRFKSLETAGSPETLDRARAIDWKAYQYAAILVPGQGPEHPAVTIAPLAIMKMRRAVQDYRKAGTAPFLIVSGGAVHPAHTKVNEAHEMREWLIAEFGLDPSEVVTEPYARHTTTNLRNTWRVLQQLGAPSDKPILVVTDRAQIDYMCSSRFEKAAMRELGYVPCKFLGTPHDHAIEVRLDKKCYLIDPSDPMDP